ncbi:MAG: PIG-L deacetylase family protein [Dermatophilaceae bacterium]
MSTIVFLHAHPDDEASQTSGTMARLVDAGHRVVVVFATNGDHGEAPEDLAPGETVVDRRRLEAEASAAAVGLHRTVWLGYADSGMTGWAQNSYEGAFAAAPVEEAAARFAAVLDEEAADIAVGYDWHGGYGHPDHVQVHRVLHAGSALAQRRPRVMESTMNRDAMRRLIAAAPPDQRGDWDPDSPMDDGNPMGTPEAEISWRVDVTGVLERKRAALASHASQTTDVGMMLAMPPEVFADAFGWEHFVEPGRAPGMTTGWPF